MLTRSLGATDPSLAMTSPSLWRSSRYPPQRGLRVDADPATIQRSCVGGQPLRVLRHRAEHPQVSREVLRRQSGLPRLDLVCRDVIVERLEERAREQELPAFLCEPAEGQPHPKATSPTRLGPRRAIDGA